MASGKYIKLKIIKSITISQIKNSPLILFINWIDLVIPTIKINRDHINTKYVNLDIVVV